MKIAKTRLTTYEVNMAIEEIYRRGPTQIDFTKFCAGGVPAWFLAEHKEFFIEWAWTQVRLSQLRKHCEYMQESMKHGA